MSALIQVPCDFRGPSLKLNGVRMSVLGLGCVKTRRRSITIEEVVRPRPFSRSTGKRIQLSDRTEKYHSSSRFDFRVFTQPGSKTDLRPLNYDVRSSPDIVAKVFSGRRTKILRAADALYARRREGPYRFVQNRPRTSVVAPKSDVAAEKSKYQLSRDSLGRSIFDFCNNICQ